MTLDLGDASGRKQGICSANTYRRVWQTRRKNDALRYFIRKGCGNAHYSTHFPLPAGQVSEIIHSAESPALRGIAFYHIVYAPSGASVCIINKVEERHDLLISAGSTNVFISVVVMMPRRKMDLDNDNTTRKTMGCPA